MRSNLFWILSCLFVAGISFAGLSESSTALVYILGFAVYCCFVFKLRGQGNLPHPLIFVTGTILVLFSEPFLENDHFRYLWEGKVLLQGGNPWRYPPDSAFLDHVSYEWRHLVGFPEYSTVYPPLAILWFSLFSFFPAFFGMKLMSLASAFILFFFLRKWDQTKARDWLPFFFPLFIKEYIQAAHIDLIAVVFLFLLPLPTFVKILLSGWTKWIGYLAFCAEKMKLKLVLIIPFSALILILFFWLQQSTDGGMGGFSAHWVWNPGLYFLFTKLFYFPAELARVFCALVFLVFSLVVFFFRQKRKLETNEALLLLYSGLMFMSPVYNGWYFIWFLIPALSLNSQYGLIYALLSPLCYFYYALPEWPFSYAILTHWPFFLILRDHLLRSVVKETGHDRETSHQ